MAEVSLENAQIARTHLGFCFLEFLELGAADLPNSRASEKPVARSVTAAATPLSTSPSGGAHRN